VVDFPKSGHKLGVQACLQHESKSEHMFTYRMQVGGYKIGSYSNHYLFGTTIELACTLIYCKINTNVNFMLTWRHIDTWALPLSQSSICKK